ncbi:hypothetical protein PF002_g28142 [Phytophthora fragariae]|uniref:Retrotransposon gag domain-containing protein n=1 Tax=Phytophthora fragariae TaxID=53985 RepID=A0A6A3W959_9STRA|nr:hypothetical protein PF002_g28142 [Phytophthora fragariae]
MDGCLVSCNSVVEASDANEYDEDDDWEVRGTVTEAAEAVLVSGGRISGVRPLTRSLVEELDNVTKAEPADEGHDRDLTREWAQEARDLSAVDNYSTTPRLKIVTHLPLNSIEPFCGIRNQSEKSMQWLRTFVYGMKGTHKPPNTWCVPFELSLYDGAQYWYRQLPRKTKRTWTLLSQAFIKYYCVDFARSAKARYYSAKRDGEEHVCDYLNRRNGYARNAGVQFEDGGRDAKHHVEHFLDTRDDRGLEECLYHVRVSDIYELEGMIDNILRYRERNSAREPSLRRYRGQDDNRRREGRSTEGPRSGYRRERGFRDSDSDRHHVRPRITPLIEALTNVFAALKARGSDGSRTSSPVVRRHGYDTTDGCGNIERAYECSQYSDEKSDDGYGSDPTHVRIESITENEHRVATNGTLDITRGMELLTPDGINLDLSHGTTTLSNEVMMHLQQRNERWVAEQPSVVDRQDYLTPRKILTRATEVLTSGGECRITSVEQNGLAPAVTDDLAGPGVHKPSVIVQEGALGRGDGELTSSEALNVDGPTAVTRGSDDGGISPTDGSAKPFKPTQGFKTSGAVVVDRSRHGDEDYGPSEGWNDHGAELTRPDTSDYSDDGATDGTERLLDAGYASAVDAMSPEDPSCNEADATDTFNHRPNEAKPMENLENETKLTGYGDKSAFIPDSSEAMLTYSEPIGQSRDMDAIQREILITNVPTPPVCNPRVMGQVTTWTLWILLLWTVVIAASAYLEDKAVTLVGYTGMRNGVSAALEPKTEALTVAGDSRFAIQQSLGAITCRWVKFMTQLCRHRDMTTKFRSVTYLHGERDFNVDEVSTVV